MRLSARLERLENAYGSRRCTLCGGQGKFVVSSINEREALPQVEGCSSCGEVFHIVVRYVRKPGPDGAFRDEGPLAEGAPFN